MACNLEIRKSRTVLLQGYLELENSMPMMLQLAAYQR